MSCIGCSSQSSEMIILQNYKFWLASKRVNDVKHSGKISIRWHELRFMSFDSQHKIICEALAYGNVCISLLAPDHAVCFPFCSLHFRWACFIRGDAWVCNQWHENRTWQLSGRLQMFICGLCTCLQTRRPQQQNHQNTIYCLESQLMVSPLKWQWAGVQFIFSCIGLECWWSDSCKKTIQGPNTIQNAYFNTDFSGKMLF